MDIKHSKFISCKKQAIFRAAMVIVSFAVVIRVVKKKNYMATLTMAVKEASK